VDQNGWKEQGKKRWLWLAATNLVAVFIIHPWRNQSALQSLLGRDFLGILCSDRWVVYNHWPDPFARQLCWEHLKPNWEAQVNRGATAKSFDSLQNGQVANHLIKLPHRRLHIDRRQVSVPRLQQFR
jgi:transposase